MSAAMIHRLKPGVSSNHGHLTGYGMLCPFILKVFIFLAQRHNLLTGICRKIKIKIKKHSDRLSGIDTLSTVLILVKYVTLIPVVYLFT